MVHLVFRTWDNTCRGEADIRGIPGTIYKIDPIRTQLAADDNHFDVISIPAMRQPVIPFPAIPDGEIRLLVVSDDPVSRQHLVTLAKRSGYRSIDACDGSASLATALELRPDLVVIDGPTPVTEPIGLVRWLRASPLVPQPYILVVASREDDRLLADADESGVDEVICKPLRPRIMALRLRTGHRIIGLQRENAHHREERQRLSEALKRSNRRMRELALTDELTGLPNRRYAMERTQLAWAAATERRLALSCIVLDLDGLSEINESHGHERGDVVLKTIAAILRERTAEQDIVCRLGGDEFLVIRPEASLAQALSWAQALVTAVGQFGIEANGCPLGLTLGVAERQPAMSDPQDLINLAEQHMYRAKRLGKNQVSAAEANEAATASTC